MKHLSFEQISVVVVEKRPRNFFDLGDPYQPHNIKLQNTDVPISVLPVCQKYLQSECTQAQRLK